LFQTLAPDTEKKQALQLRPNLIHDYMNMTRSLWLEMSVKALAILRFLHVSYILCPFLDIQGTIFATV